MNERNRSVAPLEVAIFQVLLASWFEVGQRIQMAAARRVFFRKPNLIPPEVATTQQVRIMCVEGQLSRSRITGRVAKESYDLDRHQWVQTCIQLVNPEYPAILQETHDGAEQGQIG